MRFSLRVCACGLGGTPAPHSLRHLLARKEGGTAGQTIFAISYQILSSTPQQLWPIGYSCSLLSYGPDTRGKNNYVYMTKRYYKYHRHWSRSRHRHQYRYAAVCMSISAAFSRSCARPTMRRRCVLFSHRATLGMSLMSLSPAKIPL